MRAQARGTAGGVFGLALFFTVLFFFAPLQVGGSTSYVVTEGISMLPHLHGGDLAIVRTHGSYRVGEAVLYNSPVLHRPVLHRIVAVENGQYSFKGDNNNFIDPGTVTRSALIGELWFHVPRVGGWVAWLSAPLHAAMIVAATAFLLLLGTRERLRRGRRRRGTRSPPAANPSRGQTGRLDLSGLLVPLAALALLAGMCAALGFSKPAEKTVDAPGAYQQLGDFAYVGKVNKPNPAYPTGLALTGQPLLLNLFDRVSIRFNYQFNTRLPHRIKGTIALDALIAAQTSWHQSFPVESATHFVGDSANIGGSVDLAAARTFLDQVSAQSGSIGADYDVDLRATVHITGVVDGKPIDATFTPALPFTFNHALIKLKIPTASISAGSTYNAPADTGLASILNPRQDGSVPHRIANHLVFARFALPVQMIRWLGLALSALCVIAIYTVVIPHRKRLTRREPELIQLRYGRLLVPAVAVNPDGRPTVELADFPSLVRLARHYQHLILHEQNNGRHTYGVDEDGRLYTYCIDPLLRAGLVPGQDRRGRASDARDGERRRREAAAPEGDERGRALDAPAVPTLAALPAVVAGPSMPRLGWRRRTWLRAIGLLAALGLAATLATSITASNTVPASRVGASAQALALTQLLPSQCVGIGPVTLVVMASGAASVTGTTANDLVLGRARTGNTTFSGGNGNDCILGGGGSGTKTLSGGSGNDVCVAAPGTTKSYSSCEQQY